MSADGRLVARSAARRRVGFTAHQLTEYLLGAALLVVGLHLTGSGTAPEAVLLSAGCALIALAALSTGTLGAVRVLGRGVHHALDVVLIGGLVLSPLAMLSHPNGLAIALAESVAVLLVRIERWTNYRDPAKPVPLSPPVPPGSTATDGPGLARQLGRTTAQAGEVAGALAGAFGPVAGRAARRGARRLGAAAGAARRAGGSGKPETPAGEP